MKLNKTESKNDWRLVVEDSIQVDYADIPTGETRKVVNEDGQEKTEMITVERVSFGFQTETGRGRGISWIPVEDVEDALEVLSHYAENGVDSVAASDEWLSPVESIHETITRVPSKDSEGALIEGEYDVSFRVRLGKGSKSCRVPEADFAEFVETLKGTLDAIPGAAMQVEKNRNDKLAKAAKAAEAAAGSVD